jgi:hypothetical protein
MIKNIIDKINLNQEIYDTLKIIYVNNIINSETNFITNIDIFKNLSEIQNKIETTLKSQSINYKIIKKNIKRDYYYSQIRDKYDNNTENIYTDDLIFIDKITIQNKSMILFASDKIIQNKLSFPNLSKYHLSFKINSTIIDINNINIIFENNNIFIEIKKKFDEKIFNDICDIIIEYFIN